jgi:plastocyanin
MRPARCRNAATKVPVAAISMLLLGACFTMPAAAAPTSHTVVIEGMKFAPETLTVKAGDTVIWVNKDYFPHTATAQDRRFDSGDVATNGKWQYVVKKPGALPYVCTLHPTMKGTLIVK